MKKIAVSFLFIAGMTLMSCGNQSNDKTPDTKSTDAAKPADNSGDSKSEKGLALVAKSDCFTCHKVAETSTGPAYTAVAAKYPNNQAVIDSLSEKVIKGGSGNWGSVPMIAHPSISSEDAKSMVEYVLSLKK